MFYVFNIDNVPIKKYNNSSTWVAGTGYSSYNDNKNWDIICLLSTPTLIGTLLGVIL